MHVKDAKALPELFIVYSDLYYVIVVCCVFHTESQPGTLLYSGNMQQAQQQQQTAQRGVHLCHYNII